MRLRIRFPFLFVNRRAHASVLGLMLSSLGLLASCNSSNFNTPSESIAATSGTPQSAALNMAFAAPLVATVTMGGSPVSGAFVVFTAPATGASGIFASNSSNSETDTTNASGVATSSMFTANGTIGANVVTASVAGVTATTSFNLTNTSGPASSITATSGSLQDAQIGTAFEAPLVATVVDANQNPVTGASVTFTAPSSGASGSFASNSTATETDTTNSSGVATSSVFTANATSGGPYTLTASTGALTPADFKLMNITGAVISITALGGTPQSATVNAPFAAPLVVTVLDSNQNPLSGVLVTFETPATGAGGTFAGGVNTATTNASGVAKSVLFTANGSAGSYPVTAIVASGAEPANFRLTNNPINYVFYLSGLEVASPPNFYALAGSVSVDGNGNVLGGEQDYNDGLGFQSPEPSGDTILPGAAALTVDPATGQGTLTLTTNNPNLGVSGVETLSAQFVNTNHAMIIQFDGTATSSGSMDVQTLSSTLNDGNYAFTLSGVDTSDVAVVYGGVFSISSSGGALAGTFDVDDGGTTTLKTSFSGTITGPDALGRGTITATTLPISTLNYYVVGPEAIRIIDVDTSTTDSAVGSVFGQGSGTFSNASLGNSVFAVESNSFGNLYAATGQFTVPASGSFTGFADDNEFDNGVIVPGASISGSYSVSSGGYGSLTIAPGNLGDLSVFGIYMTDPDLNLNDPNNTASGLGGALLADLDTNLSGTGVLIPQTDISTSSFTGNYAFGAQAYNVGPPPTATSGWEFDFVGQGSVSGGALSGAGILSDPFGIFQSTSLDGTDTATFSGTASPDSANAGRYTIPLNVKVTADPTYSVVIYQAEGGQLFSLDENSNGNSVFLGMLQQQGSLTGLPAARNAFGKIVSTRKHRQLGRRAR